MRSRSRLRPARGAYVKEREGSEQIIIRKELYVKETIETILFL